MNSILRDMVNNMKKFYDTQVVNNMKKFYEFYIVSRGEQHLSYFSNENLDIK